MRRRDKKAPQGQEKRPPTQEGGVEAPYRTEVLEELSFLIFQVALARRRVEDIMDENDLAMVSSWRELTFVHNVLTSVDSLLRSLRNAAISED